MVSGRSGSGVPTGEGTNLEGLTAPLPGEGQIRADVYTCLLDAITDQFPVARPDIEHDTVPSKNPIGADGQGWGICLATFAAYLHSLRPAYIFYVHKPAYTQATLDEPVSKIVPYLAKAVITQAKGLGG